MTATIAPPPPAREIPNTFAASVRSWWSVGEKESATSEERLLRRLPFFRPQPLAGQKEDLASGPVSATSARVQLAHPKHFLNTLSITANAGPYASAATAAAAPVPDVGAKAKGVAPPAVVLHGYGAGLGFFFQNFPALASWAGRRQSAVYAVDWLGMGRSARPPFVVRAKRTDVDARVAEAESFFIDALEEWRVRMGLEKMTLVGHSLGGYLSVAYALKHPSRVSKLVLLSPAGVPRDPNDTTQPSRELTDDQVEDQSGTAMPGSYSHSHSQSHTRSEPGAKPMPKRGDSALAARFSPNSKSPNGGAAEAPEPATPPRVNRIRSAQKAEKEKESRTRKLFTYLWEEGWSPFQLVRSSLFWGPLLVGKYSARRFRGLSEDETKEMHDYILNITLAKGSGEYCISHILAPGAHARRPLVDRVAALKIPVTFVYGDQDWMDPAGGTASVENLRKAGNLDCRSYVVPYAGHHVYLDNSKAVNELLVKELDRVPEQ